MDIFAYALMVGAVVALILSRNVPRAWAWICLGIISYTLSAFMHDANIPYAALLGVVTDFAIAIAILAFAKRRWEIAVVDCFGFMILVDLMWTANMIPSRYLYVTILELANWAALIVIGVTGVLQEATDGGLSARSRLSRLAGHAYRYLRESAAYPRWWRHP